MTTMFNDFGVLKEGGDVVLVVVMLVVVVAPAELHVGVFLHGGVV